MSSTVADSGVRYGFPTMEQSTNEEPKKPHSIWFHPYLSWKDLIISFLFSLMIPFRNQAKHSPNSKDGRKINDQLRESLIKLVDFGFPRSCKKWSETAGGLAQCTWKIPRRPSTLHEWGIIGKQDALMKQVEASSPDDNGFIDVHVWCPLSLLTKQVAERNEYGCVEVDSIDLKSISKDVPIVLWFHGGGLVMGNFKNGMVETFLPLLEKQKKATRSVPQVIFLAATYRLAPEHPLPAASIDALSVVDFILQNNKERKIHLCGVSAGGYLSSVTAFGAHRKYPGRIQSALIHSPFISPAADSMSYFMNGSVSIAVPASWLRWAWRAAFELDNDNEATEGIIARGSNRAAWNKSKWRKSEAWRNFLEPLEGVPSGLGDRQGTRYIVAVCKADTLYDEGIELALKLKKNGAQVTLVEANGTHVLGFDCDPVAKDTLMEAWRNEIFVHEKLD